jgi:1-phosphatidylinositol-5-phosphate 4-kinase
LTDGLSCVFVLISERRKYDLKGSTVDREASDKEKEKDLPTLKDNDFVKDGTKVVIGDEAKERLMETLTADVEVIHFPRRGCFQSFITLCWCPFQFLMKLQMMDYSLLLGVHDCEKAEQENLEHPERKFRVSVSIKRHQLIDPPVLFRPFCFFDRK